MNMNCLHGLGLFFLKTALNEYLLRSVYVEHCISVTSPVKSGVLQGSVLCPIFFILYVNSLDDILVLNVLFKLFPDDVKLFLS